MKQAKVILLKKSERDIMETKQKSPYLVNLTNVIYLSTYSEFVMHVTSKPLVEHMCEIS